MYESSGNIYNTIAQCTVVDTNDPQGNRIKVYCPDYGDLSDTQIDNLPWCQCMQLFSGMINSESMTRGESKHSTVGNVAYGTHFLPKVGSIGLLTCLNGDPTRRIFLGCLPPVMADHTMPHGRYLDGDGPFSSSEQPIQPLYDNLKKAFGDDPTKHEFKSRATDSTVTGLPQHVIDSGKSQSSKKDENTGYKKSRLQPDLKNPQTDATYDSQIFSITTPGFHTLSMDDSEDNCRVRIRTTCGHNIILDDTNERIYINTAHGNNWIEIDQDGTIDIYSAKSISINADADINLHAKKDIKLNAENIHLNASTNINLKSDADTNIDAKNIIKSASEKFSLSCKKGDIKSKKSLNMKGESTSIKGGKSMSVSSPKTSVSGKASMDISGAKTSVSGKGMLSMSGAVTNVSGKGMLNMSGAATNISGKGIMTMGAPALFSSQGIGKSFGLINSGIMANVMNTINNLPSAVLGELSNIAGLDLANLSNMVGGELAGMMDQIGDLANITDMLPDIGSIMGELPLDSLSGIMDSLPDIGSIMGQLPDIGNIMGQLPDISGMLGGLSDIGNILEQLPNVDGLLNSLPNVDGLLNSLPLDNLTNIMGSLPTDNLMSVMNNVADVGNLLNTLPNITNNLGSNMIGGLLSNVSNDLLPDIMISLPNLPSALPNISGDNLNKIFTDLPHDASSMVLNMLPSSKIGDVLYNIPTNDLPNIIKGLSQTNQNAAIKSLPLDMLNGIEIGDNKMDVTQFDISSIQSELSKIMNVPNIISANDFGHMVKDIPNISDILGNDIDLSSSLLGDMNGYLSGGILKNAPDLLSKFTDGDVGNILNAMPVDDIKSMIGSVPDLLSSISPDSLGKMFDGLQGADISGIFDSVPNMDDLMSGLNIPDFGNVLSNIPNINMAGIMGNLKIDNLSAMLSEIPMEDLGNVLNNIPNVNMMEILNNVDVGKAGEMLECMAPDKLDSIIEDASMGEAMTSTPKVAAYPSRIPMHEPWGRSNTTSDTDKAPKHAYDDENVGKNDGVRNSNWKR